MTPTTLTDEEIEIVTTGAANYASNAELHAADPDADDADSDADSADSRG